MEKKQKIGIALLILLMIATIGGCMLKIYSEMSESQDMATGNYYTKVSYYEAEFLGKFTRTPRRMSSRGQTYDKFKLIESGEIVEIACGFNSGHTGEKYVTIAAIDYYSKDSNKHLYQQLVVENILEK
ncbi:MAG: hypothetical protein IJW20_01040 [Clostridia bacterium]|nr:hypothetical protein [Clostridia bacterium]